MTTITVLLIAVVAALAVWHYTYQAIILPIIREKLCFSLFGLRDDLRQLKLKEGTRFDDSLFDEVQTFLNRTIAKLPYLGIVAVIRAFRAIKTDEKLRDQANTLARKIEACPIPEVGKIFRGAIGLAYVGIFSNSGGWLPTIVPVIAVMYFWNEARKVAPTLLFVSEITPVVSMAH